MSELWSGIIDIYKYLTSTRILLSKERQIKEQLKFPYHPLEKAFQK